MRPEFQEQLTTMLLLALATSTEKARSEFVIAPVLLELWLLRDRKIGLLSGVEFSFDEAQGLNGVCDYILTRLPEQLFVTSPVLMLVEAKNEDMKRGFAQCGAEMIAAQKFNEREGDAVDRIYGVVKLENCGDLYNLKAHDYKLTCEVITSSVCLKSWRSFCTSPDKLRGDFTR